jgi:hypothetical protein
MRNSNFHFWLGLVLAGSAPGMLRADNLILADDARLTGTVRSINEAGVVELATVLSPEPLLLKAGAVEKVEFSVPGSAAAPAGTLIELANGDLLPAAVESLDDTSLHVVTADAGRLSIPRTALKSMQLGVRQQKVVYRGPKNSEEWGLYAERSKNWQFANDALTANGPSQAARDFDAPPQFILKFTLKWQANPMFKIYFADPLTPKVELVDRYFMQYGSAGLEIKRESSKGKRYQTVIQLPRTPDQFPSDELAVEIRVDRKTSRLHLLLNGEPEGAGVDPVGDPPQGNGVVLVSNSPAGPVQEIRGIEILELDTAGTRHRAEGRGDVKTDSLISRDEDRWGGRLIGIRKGPEGAVFSFKSDFQEEPLELAEADVSAVFFAKPAQTDVLAPVHQFVLRLRGEGSLRVASCAFSADEVSARHPLLGPLKIRRAGVSGMERLDSKPEVKSKE